MALAYQDFWPMSSAVRRAPGGVAWEPLPAVIQRVNRWQADHRVRVINVETLLMPALKKEPLNPATGGVVVRWDEDHAQVQVVRVWYEELPAPVSPPVLPEPVRPSEEIPPGVGWPQTPEPGPV
jgi:hypothetical protein